MSMYNIYSSFIKSCNIVVYNIDYIQSVYDVLLCKYSPYCIQKDIVRSISTYNNNIQCMSDDSIYVGYKVSKNKYIQGKICKGSMNVKYKYEYTENINNIIYYICNSLSCTADSVYIYNISFRVCIPNIYYGIDEILLCAMRSDTIVPNERDTEIYANVAKLIHLYTCKSLRVRYVVMNSVMRSIDINMEYGSVYLELCVKQCIYDYVDIITSDILKLIYSINSNSYIRVGDRSLDINYYINDRHNINVTKYNRSKAPDMIISRFTRESPDKIYICSTEDEANQYKLLGYSCIRYPRNGYWYVSADISKHMGLKINRLNNKDVYKYIPAVYIKNHIDNPSSNAYKYIHNIDNTLDDDNKEYISELPTCIANILDEDDKHMYKCLNLNGNINNILDVSVTEDMCVLCKQDIPNMLVKDIYNMWIDKPYWSNIEYYRSIIEYTYNADVVIVTYNKGFNVTDNIISNSYLWNCRYSHMILIFKTMINEYTQGYQLILYNNNILIHRDTNIYKYFISIRLSNTCRYTDIHDDITTQYISYNGICTAHTRYDNVIKYCYHPPVLAPYIEEYTSDLSITDDNTCIYNINDIQLCYDNIILIGNNKYYESQLIPHNYIPYSIKDIYNDAIVIDKIDNINIYNHILYITIHTDGYIYYLLI